MNRGTSSGRTIHNDRKNINNKLFCILYSDITNNRICGRNISILWKNKIKENLGRNSMKIEGKFEKIGEKKEERRKNVKRLYIIVNSDNSGINSGVIK